MSVGDFTLLRPWWLLALLPLAWLLWRMARHPAGQGGWLPVVDAHLLPHLLLERSRYGRVGGLALLGASLSLAVLALAGPAVPGAVDVAYRSDAARVLVLDLSAAMGPAEPPSARLERTRLKLLDLLRAVPQGQSGLVLYAEEPYLAAPLTTDVANIALLVPELSPEVMPLAGDRPERALSMAGDILARSGAEQRDLLWITASPAPPAALAALVNARAAGARVSVLHPDAVADAALRSAIEAGGGLYLAMQADGADVRALAKLLGSAKTRVSEAQRNAATQRDVGPWLLLMLLPLAALAFRRGLLLMLMLALPLLLIPPPAEAFDLEGLWQRADQRGWRLLQAGDADAAARRFADPRWRAVAHYRAGRYEQAAATLAPLNDADAHYNRGNALARLGRLDQALVAYERALKLRPADADMRHNRDLMLQLLKQRQNPEATAADAPPSPPPQKQPEPGQGQGGAQDPTKRSADAPPPSGQGSAEPRPPAASSSAAPQPAPASIQQETVAGAPLTERDTVQREAGLLAEQWLRRMPSEQSGLLRRKLMLEHARRQAGEVEQPWRQNP